MQSVLAMSAAELLAVPLDRPFALFHRNADVAETTWRALARQWHPDRAAAERAAEHGSVLAHINRLYDTAKAWRQDGRWESDHRISLRGEDGRTRRLGFLARRPDELGELLIARSVVSLLADRADDDLLGRATRIIGDLRYADTAMAAEMAPWLPRLRARFRTPKQSVLVLDKPADTVRLADLLQHAGGRLEPRHVGWILNGMLHVACYLEWAGLAHNAIGPETWFVSPGRHAGALLGGWMYAARAGERLLAAPARTVRVAPSCWRTAKRAAPALDRELIRQTGRELLGDPAGSRLASRSDVPRPLADWLAMPPAANAPDDYRGWRRALEVAFGPPRFVTLPITPGAVYGAPTETQRS